MADAIHNAISILLKESSLSENEMHAAVLQVMDGNASAVGLGMLLTALRLKGETVDEIVGAARALRERAIRIPTQRPGLLDTCGTGGDELSTFNISTATALVTAACGVPVAKHSNRGFTSRSGSADVLEALGVRIDLTPQEVARAIDEIGIGFCFAPVAHGAMKYAAPVRKQLGFRTVFNMLGPLTNPAGAEFQLVGAGRIAVAEKLAESLVRLGTARALVVCGNDELDEVSLWGTTMMIRVEHGEIERFQWRPADLGLEECQRRRLACDVDCGERSDNSGRAFGSDRAGAKYRFGQRGGRIGCRAEFSGTARGGCRRGCSHRFRTGASHTGAADAFRSNSRLKSADWPFVVPCVSVEGAYNSMRLQRFFKEH